jgi:hypothetical protein
MAGRLVPVPPAPFAPIPFAVAAAEIAEDEAETSVGPPPLPTPAPTTPAELARARAALAELERWWDRVPLLERKQAAKQPGKLDRPLRDALKPLRAALRGIHTVDTAELRRWLDDEAVPTIEWLLGLGSRRGAGEAPALGKDLLFEVVRLRADARVRGNRGFATWLQGRRDLPPREVLHALGRVVDGRDDDLWRALVEWPATDAALRGEWARAVTTALCAAPSLAANLSEKDARRLMERALSHLREVAEGAADRHKEAIFRLACVFPWVFAVRGRGLLPPSDAEVVATREQLVALYDALPKDVRTYGGRDAVTQGDGPIAVAADWLAGRYATMLDLEDP